LGKRLAARAAGSNQPAQRKPSADVLAWQAAGLHCSANERRADEASRDVEAWLKCKYMREHLGEEFSGVVSSVTSFGLFVTLDAMYVEGLIHITELGGEYFRFDEARQELRGERTGMRYSLGSRVEVQVSRVDLDGRRIDFRLVRDADDVTQRASRDKAVAADASGGTGRSKKGGDKPVARGDGVKANRAERGAPGLPREATKSAKAGKADARGKARKSRR
jgi:ribonuclease R